MVILFFFVLFLILGVIKMKFKTQYDEHTRVNCDPGNPVKDVYSAFYDVDGVLKFEKSGQEDLYGFIQSHAESCDIHVILERFAAGETDVLSRAQGFYADTSDMPKTYMEVLNSVLAGEQAFAELPAEVKRQFGNSFSVWVASFDKPDFAEKMGWSQTSQQVQDFASSSAPASAASAAPAAPASAAPAAPAPAPAG
ncbi:internal scaffolding protein [Sigmofec virus UA08Rod_5692]|uniref:Internal scaffolding protein n=1 Tax=Sigmofec virus UA08Rod_5692 TaxID=2929436 RepID=A0A976R8J3_9VIRU|nr:internal scaffolding protein [Sigmofec virus UA08Rod_5692]